MNTKHIIETPARIAQTRRRDVIVNRSTSSLSRIGALGLIVIGPLFAQVEDKKATASEAPVELAPFIINAEEDTGYVAQNTLGGTRTRTPLKDVASSIGVFTADFISDLGARNEKDILAYSASAVPELSEQSASVGGNPIGTPVFQYRVRGQLASRTRNYFTTLNPPDTYNIERFEEARGPNAILFGIGGAGGILNHLTKRAMLTRQQTNLGVTVNNSQLLRGELDHNQVLIANKLALRFNAVAQESQGWRPNEFDHERRADLAGTFQILPKLKLSVEIEDGRTHDTSSRKFGAQDNMSLWLDNGRPTVATRTANAAAGIALTANRPQVTVVANDGSMRNFQQTPQSTTDVSRRNASIVDERIVPRSASFEGPGAERYFDFNSETVFLEFEPLRNLSVEVAADYQTLNSDIYDPRSRAYAFFGEPAQFYRDGSPNPYVGRFYTESNWTLVERRENLRTFRISASYSLDLGKWGRHNVAGMVQDNRDRLFQTNQIPVLLGRPFDTDPAGATNGVYIRTYITNPADVSQYSAASWKSIPAQVSVVMDPGAPAVTYNTGWIPNQNNPLGDDWTQIKTYIASIQNYFFKDRFVSAFGVRRDQRFAYSRPVVYDPAAPLRYIDYSKVTLTPATADQYTLGLVYHVTPWLSLLYNQSRNAQVLDARTLIPDGVPLPLSPGKGRDLGFTTSLLDGKVFARLVYFETSSIDAAKTFGVTGNVIGRNNRILDTMVAAGTLTSAQAAAQRLTGSDLDVLDRKSQGYELSLTANPTPNWRMVINGSQGKSVEANMLKRTKTLMPGLLTSWKGADQAAITVGSTTVAQEIVDFNTWFASNTAVEGKSSLGDREWQLKFFNRYDFTSNFLKGWYAGGGWRYVSAPIIGANTTTLVSYRGESSTEVDLLLGYQIRVGLFGQRTRLSVQLNANDLLQRRDYLSVRRDPSGLLSVIRIVDPTAYSLQAKLSF